MKVRVTIKFKGIKTPVLPRAHGIYDVEELEELIAETFNKFGSRVSIRIRKYEDPDPGESANPEE